MKVREEFDKQKEQELEESMILEQKAHQEWEQQRMGMHLLDEREKAEIRTKKESQMEKVGLQDYFSVSWGGEQDASDEKCVELLVRLTLLHFRWYKWDGKSCNGIAGKNRIWWCKGNSNSCNNIAVGAAKSKFHHGQRWVISRVKILVDWIVVAGTVKCYWIFGLHLGEEERLVY